MNSEFCMQCGSKVEFSLRAPNFCPSCGNKFNENAEASSTKEGEDTGDPVEPTSIPSISKLEYSIGEMPGQVTFGDLAAQTQSSQQPYEKMARRPTPPNVKGEDILKVTMAECSSARQPEDVSGE